ncbi:MAG: hypothetical protein RL728_30 [Bacteroidota bacterium]
MSKLPSVKIITVISVIIVIVFVIPKFFFKDELIDPVIQLTNEGNTLVGSRQCRNCHEDIFDSYLNTAHSKTSLPANRKTVKGSFKDGENNFIYSYYDGIVMKDLDSGLFQLNFLNRKFDKAYQFDIVIGSGTRGQSYLNWAHDRLLQLPISYYTTSNSWANSPGFPNDVAFFGRAIGSQCLGCHASFVNTLPVAKGEIDRFDKNSIVFGVNCEKCHGPGGNHVDLLNKNPNAKGDLKIVNAKKLSQRQQLDACGICHSSISKDLKPALGFRTGDTIYNTFQFDTTHNLDVHGNQYGLLKQSKCFINSTKMTCSSCHDVHKNERGDKKIFSLRCMGCHTKDKTNYKQMAPELSDDVIMSNCIDCHMPNKNSEILNVQLSLEAKHRPAVIRSHHIKIYKK